jgi:hypothetical protein
MTGNGFKIGFSCELAPLLEEGMARLGQKERDAVVMRFFENYSVREVAAAVGLGGRRGAKAFLPPRHSHVRETEGRSRFRVGIAQWLTVQDDREKESAKVCVFHEPDNPKAPGYSGTHPVGQQLTVLNRNGASYVEIRDVGPSEVLVLVNRP